MDIYHWQLLCVNHRTINIKGHPPSGCDDLVAFPKMTTLVSREWNGKHLTAVSDQYNIQKPTWDYQTGVFFLSSSKRCLTDSWSEINTCVIGVISLYWLLTITRPDLSLKSDMWANRRYTDDQQQADEPVSDWKVTGLTTYMIQLSDWVMNSSLSIAFYSHFSPERNISTTVHQEILYKNWINSTDFGDFSSSATIRLTFSVFFLFF